MKSMKLTALLLAAVTAISMTAVAVPAATDQVEAIKKAGKIQMTTNAEFEPFEYKDGDEIVGKIICYSDEGFSGSASGFNTGGYDNAVDGLTELYKSGEKVSFTWFGYNLYCCPENAVSYPIECAVFHKPSVVYLYNAEQGAPIHRNNAE